VTGTDAAAAWRAADLTLNHGWEFELDERAQRDLVAAVEKAYAPGRSLLDCTREDCGIGSAAPVLDRALDEVKRGRGLAIIRGLPRQRLDEKQFEFLTWAMGLHAGVARPQGKATHYISAVRDAGSDYRTGSGRGYASNAELDYHTDSSDIVFLTCYNRAASGGMTIVTSSLAAYDVMSKEHPDMIQWLHRPIHFSRQGEQAPDEGETVLQPIFDEKGGKRFSRWNWNRIALAQKLPGVPQLSDEHWAALKRFDEIVRRPELAYSMWLQPGDVQLVNSHVTLHSRTDFVDSDDPSQKRLLYRLWLAPPDSDPLPESWGGLYRSVMPGTVRGGIRGHAYGAQHENFEARQARSLGMTMPV
jgi:hypothetical protein